MKKTFLLLAILLLALAVLTSACKLPAPGGAPPTQTTQSDTGGQPTDTGIQPTTDTGSPQTTTAPEEPAGDQPKADQPTATQLPTEASTAVPVVPTAVPPTATQVPTEAQKATLPSNAQRIQFVSGSTSATVTGELEAGKKADYVLNIAAGQTLKAEVWSPNGDVYLSIIAPDGTLLLDPATKQTVWMNVVNAAGDYFVTAASSAGKTSYSVTVVIPAETNASPTATLAPTSSGAAFDPYKTYGTPDFVDSLDKSSLLDWSNPDGTLPDTKEIRLFVDGDKFLVTGKMMDFSTWWFNWASLGNFYMELTVDSRTCADRDAYGLILRGPGHGAGISYGYVVSFTCDGRLWVYRLDGVKPWNSTDLYAPTVSSYIAQGSNARNVIGVKAMGDTVTVYANGFQVFQFTDRHYLEGRYGLFVRPDSTDFYTYEAVKIAYWSFDE
jgi:hypothetical protein